MKLIKQEFIKKNKDFVLKHNTDAEKNVTLVGYTVNKKIKKYPTYDIYWIIVLSIYEDKNGKRFNREEKSLFSLHYYEEMGQCEEMFKLKVRKITNAVNEGAC